MWPWGHLGAGYLCYSLVVRVQGLVDARQVATDGAGAIVERTPSIEGRLFALSGATVLAVALGTQLPDLVDKPLAWTLGVLPNGRSLAHSAITALVVLGAGWLAFDRRRALVAALGVGWMSHLVADGWQAILAGSWQDLGYLGWPIVPAIEYTTEPSFAAHLAQLELSGDAWVGIGLFVAAGVVWVRDGLPGASTVRRWLSTAVR